jgi:hypothetical protein
MWSNNYKDIEPITQRMFQRIREGDIEGARGEKENLIQAFKTEIQYIVEGILEGRIKK